MWDSEKTIVLAGNPNVGKSTVFNALTGLKQHTGNWPGKTVETSAGSYGYRGVMYTLVDIPGTYSLLTHSAEEEVARNYLCFGDSHGVVVVCDATCLERNLNLVLQILESTGNLVVCINLMDEAKKKGIVPDTKALSEKLGVPVIPTAARSGEGLDTLKRAVAEMATSSREPNQIVYPENIEAAVAKMLAVLNECNTKKLNPRWLALQLLQADPSLPEALTDYLGYPLAEEPAVRATLQEIWRELPSDALKDQIIQTLLNRAEALFQQTVTFQKADYNAKDRKLDRLLTGRLTGVPVMLGLLALIFWITITFANYPSALLSEFLFGIQDKLEALFLAAHAPNWLTGILVHGMYRVLAWVVAVMLPPMAIFFPMFTLLEDLGYLPRVAFNLDKGFQKCKACGKQALTMCMGFGCNAVGVTGCRIIDSPRERLIAMLTNSFVPCNGRFPTLITIITLFFVGGAGGLTGGLLSAVCLTGIILLGVGMTFLASRVLSATVLSGVPSSFTLELPPYRRPQIGQVVVRSILDRTLFVLGRAVMVAAPAGIVIWLFANISPGGVSLLARCANALDPIAGLMGLDGFILMAFILGFPANEIVLPILVMAYLATGTILEPDSMMALKTLLVDNGWTWATAVSMMLFSLMHWPCSTTCLTIKKETGSWRWTVFSVLLPTLCGFVLCTAFTACVRVLGLV